MEDTLYSELTTGDSFLRTFFKVIKEGIKSLGIGGTFITGVLRGTADKYIEFFEQFMKDHSVEILFDGYYRVYVYLHPPKRYTVRLS